MNFKKNNLNIISGGQTGVERAALDFALCNGLSCSGWCQAGRRDENGIIPYRYPLYEFFSGDIISLVLQNILESDGVLIIIFEEMDPLTQLAYDLSVDHQKPVFVWNLSKNRNFRMVTQWIGDEKIGILNITGPNEKTSPGIHEITLDVLADFFPDLLH